MSYRFEKIQCESDREEDISKAFGHYVAEHPGECVEIEAFIRVGLFGEENELLVKILEPEAVGK